MSREQRQTRGVHSVTDAPQRHSEEQHERMVRYSIQMGLRVLCFILAGVTGIVWESWWSLVFVFGAVVLPYTAVVGANAGGDRYMRSREAGSPEHLLTTGGEEPAEDDAEDAEDETTRQQDSGPGGPEGDVTDQAGPDVVRGEVIRDNRH